jgi:hypothetical protein
MDDVEKITTSAILEAVAKLEAMGIPPEDVVDTLFVLGSNAVVDLMGLNHAADLFEKMATELRAARTAC